MLIIAHRGARSTHPENTLSAIQAAIEYGCEAVEIDIHEHLGEFWVIHDKWLNRTTNATGRLDWFSKEELAGLDAGNGEPVPTLKQMLTLIQGRCAINIEIKGISHFNLLLEHIEFALDQCSFVNEQITISSFNHVWLDHLRHLNSNLILGALTSSKGTDLSAFAEELEVNSVNIDLDVVDKEFVLDARSRGLKVYVFTANEPEDWKWLESIGVDGLFCDCPEKAITFYPQEEEFTWE